uniref:Uncharacterized protein n=1 Tax=Spongospora subterranea TaxID=70186 RepID=A0A0H5R2Y6_9EUKA|eukprot:CRZ08257.1 hypothetical protein [Spongospora subterranea]
MPATECGSGLWRSPSWTVRGLFTWNHLGILAMIVVVLLALSAISAECSQDSPSSIVPDKVASFLTSFQGAIEKNCLKTANFAIMMLILHDQDVFTKSIGRNFLEKIIIFDAPQYLTFLLLAPNVCDFLNLPSSNFQEYKSAFFHESSHYSSRIKSDSEVNALPFSDYGGSCNDHDGLNHMHKFFEVMKDHCEANAGFPQPSRLRCRLLHSDEGSPSKRRRLTAQSSPLSSPSASDFVDLLAISAKRSPSLLSSNVLDLTLSFHEAIQGNIEEQISSESLMKAYFAIQMLILHNQDVFTASIGREFVQQIITYHKPEYLPFVLLAPNICDFLNLPSSKSVSAFNHELSVYLADDESWSFEDIDNTTMVHQFFKEIDDRCQAQS